MPPMSLMPIWSWKSVSGLVGRRLASWPGACRGWIWRRPAVAGRGQRNGGLAGGVGEGVQQIRFAQLGESVVRRTGIVHDHIRRHAIALDGFARGREIQRGGEPQRPGIVDGHDRLHRAFAEGFGAEHQGAAVLLQGGGDDFGGRGGAGIGQDDDGRAIGDIARTGRTRPGRPG